MESKPPQFSSGPPSSGRRRSESPKHGGNLIDQIKLYVVQVSVLCETMLEYLDKQHDGSKQADDKSQGNSQEDEAVAFLKQKLRELVDMNVSWQKTHQQQEQRILEQEEQIRQLSLQLETVNVAGGLSEQQQAEIDRQLLDQKNKYRLLEDEKLTLEEQIFKLRREVDAFNEKVQVLEVQLVINREDFDNERKDRERAQSRVAELEQELEKYRAKSLYQAPAFTPTQYSAGPVRTGSGITNQWWNQRPTGRYMVDALDGHGLDMSDCVEDSSVIPPRSSGTLSIDSGMVNEDPLQCPNCRRRFTRDQHEELMDHMDRCDNR